MGLINAGHGGVHLVGESILQLAEERKWHLVAITEAHAAEGSSISWRDEYGSLLDDFRVVLQPRPAIDSNQPPGGVMLLVRDAWCRSASITCCLDAADVMWVHLADLEGTVETMDVAVAYFPPLNCASLCNSSRVDCCCRRSHVDRGFDEIAQHIAESGARPNVTFVGCGDMNAHVDRWDTRGRLLVNTLREVGAELIESEPTRVYRGQRPAVLDRFFVLSSQRSSFGKAVVLGAEHCVSDHRPVEIVVRLLAGRKTGAARDFSMPLRVVEPVQRVLSAPHWDRRWQFVLPVTECIYESIRPRPQTPSERLIAWQRSREAAIWESGLEATGIRRQRSQTGASRAPLRVAKAALRAALATGNQASILVCRRRVAAIRTPMHGGGETAAA